MIDPVLDAVQHVWKWQAVPYHLVAIINYRQCRTQDLVKAQRSWPSQSVLQFATWQSSKLSIEHWNKMLYICGAPVCGVSVCSFSLWWEIHHVSDEIPDGIGGWPSSTWTVVVPFWIETFQAAEVIFCDISCSCIFCFSLLGLAIFLEVQLVLFIANVPDAPATPLLWLQVMYGIVRIHASSWIALVQIDTFWICVRSMDSVD